MAKCIDSGKSRDDEVKPFRWAGCELVDLWNLLGAEDEEKFYCESLCLCFIYIYASIC